jgi:carbamoyl-phosphate synthase large subunit
MQSVGEVMSIASTFTESLTKAIRSLEIGKTGIRNIDNRFINLSKAHLEEEIKTPRPRRIFAILEGIRRNWDIKKIADLSNIDIWFLNEIEKSFNVTPETTPTSILKMLGWTDEDLDSKDKKNSLKDNRVYKLVDTCSAEFESKTPYLYSTNGSEDDDNASNNKKVVVIGSGPNRIGQGIEFDYCCVHGVESLKENKYESIMINSNPETVSTDYDTADKLYFEPLSWDEVNSVLMREQPDSVIIQLGGQTPLKLAKKIHESGYNIAGSSLAVIDATEDRNLFQKLCESQDINQPISQIASNENDLIDSVNKIGFPVLLRPSYVLGGRAMRVVQNDAELKNYLSILASADEDGNPFNSGPLLVDQFLTDTVEVDVDLISDGKEVFIAGVLEHLEPAGVHSGDSTAVLPPFSIDKKIINEIEQKSIQLAKALNVKGLLNIQFAIKKDKLYILEANPRASRTMPFVAKVTGNQIIKAGTLLMLGHSLDFVKKETDYLNSSTNKIAIKKAIFPWSRFPAEDTMLGPEMKATGEVLGIGSNFGTALNKAYAAAGVLINKKQKGVFISLSDKEKPNFVEIAKNYSQLGFKIFTTEGTGAYLREHKISSTTVGRANDKSPTSLTIIEENLVSLVINTPTFANEYTDGWKIRRLSHETGVAVVSSVREAQAFMKAFSEQENTLDDMEAIQNVS